MTWRGRFLIFGGSVIAAGVLYWLAKPPVTTSRSEDDLDRVAGDRAVLYLPPSLAEAVTQQAKTPSDGSLAAAPPGPMGSVGQESKDAALANSAEYNHLRSRMMVIFGPSIAKLNLSAGQAARVLDLLADEHQMQADAAAEATKQGASVDVVRQVSRAAIEQVENEIKAEIGEVEYANLQTAMGLVVQKAGIVPGLGAELETAGIPFSAEQVEGFAEMSLKAKAASGDGSAAQDPVGGEFGIPASRQALIENARRVLSPAQIEALINYEIRMQARKQQAKK